MGELSEILGIGTSDVVVGISVEGSLRFRRVRAGSMRIVGKMTRMVQVKFKLNQVSAVDCCDTRRRHCLFQTDQTNNKFGQQLESSLNDNCNFNHIHHDRRADGGSSKWNIFNYR